MQSVTAGAVGERFARAVQSAEAAARLAPRRSDVHYLVADLYAQLGRFSEARRWLKAAA